MSISMYQTSAPVFARGLTNLKGILVKGAAHAAAKKIDEAVFLNARLFPDMLPFARPQFVNERREHRLRAISPRHLVRDE